MLLHHCTNNVNGSLVVTHMVRLRSNRRTSAEAESNDGKQVKGKGEDNNNEDLESLLQFAVKNLRTTKASAKVTSSKIGEKTNDDPSQPLFMKDAKILDAASLHSGMRDFSSKRRRGNLLTTLYTLDKISTRSFTSSSMCDW